MKNFAFREGEDFLVPIPINFNEVEIGAIPTTIYVKKFKVGGRSGYDPVFDRDGSPQLLSGKTVAEEPSPSHWNGNQSLER